MRLASWNVNSLAARMSPLQRWAAEAAPDVLCLQETKVSDPEFPDLAIRALGYEHIAFSGQKTYNGVAILSRLPLEDVHAGFRDGGEADPQRRLIRATVGGVRVVCGYVPNGQAVGSDKFRYKLTWLERLRLDLAGEPQDRLLVCGDLNIAPGDRDTWDPFETEGQLLCHPAERAALSRIVKDHGLHDAYREKNPNRREYSWWDYRNNGFPKNHGLRIDHILLAKPLLDRCQDVRIWKEVRGWPEPSDHTPVGVDLDIDGLGPAGEGS